MLFLFKGEVTECSVVLVSDVLQHLVNLGLLKLVTVIHGEADLLQALGEHPGFVLTVVDVFFVSFLIGSRVVRIVRE